MKVYKVTLIEVDANNELDEAGIKDILENMRYPNHCMAPSVISVESREIGEWSDEHPLNKHDTFRFEVERLFGPK